MMQPYGFVDAYTKGLISRNWETIRQVRKPVIAAVAGFALGGGCELAMMCDIVIAADTAQVRPARDQARHHPGAGGTQRLPRAVGKAKAMDMVLTGADDGCGRGRARRAWSRASCRPPSCSTSRSLPPQRDLRIQRAERDDGQGGGQPRLRRRRSPTASLTSGACSIRCSAPRTRTRGWRRSWPSASPTSRHRWELACSGTATCPSRFLSGCAPLLRGAAGDRLAVPGGGRVVRRRQARTSSAACSSAAPFRVHRVEASGRVDGLRRQRVFGELIEAARDGGFTRQRQDFAAECAGGVLGACRRRSWRSDDRGRRGPMPRHGDDSWTGRQARPFPRRSGDFGRGF